MASSASNLSLIYTSLLLLVICAQEADESMSRLRKMYMEDVILCCTKLNLKLITVQVSKVLYIGEIHSWYCDDMGTFYTFVESDYCVNFQFGRSLN